MVSHYVHNDEAFVSGLLNNAATLASLLVFLTFADHSASVDYCNMIIIDLQLNLKFAF